MFFVFSMRLSPIQPESGSTGTDCATKSFFLERLEALREKQRRLEAECLETETVLMG